MLSVRFCQATATGAGPDEMRITTYSEMFLTTAVWITPDSADTSDLRQIRRNYYAPNAVPSCIRKTAEVADRSRRLVRHLSDAHSFPVLACLCFLNLYVYALTARFFARSPAPSVNFTDRLIDTWELQKLAKKYDITIYPTDWAAAQIFGADGKAIREGELGKFCSSLLR